MYAAEEALGDSLSGAGRAPFRPDYSAREELANVISHGMGFFAAVIGFIILLFSASTRGTTLHLIGASVFGVTLLLLYGASTVYHGLPHYSRAKTVMRKLDHIAIYLLIAGTYTPFMLLESLGPRGEMTLVLVWVLAASGVIFELVRSSQGRRISVAFYLGMGWLAVFVREQLMLALEPTGLVLLVTGGLVYSIGVCFYAWTRLPYNHAVWHAFVLCGSGLHFASILGFVLP